MIPDIALVLCILFVIYVFKIDIKRKSDVSPAVWVSLIWFMIMLSRPVASWFYRNSSELGGSSAKGILEGNPIDRTIFIILMVIASIVLSKRTQSLARILKSNSWTLLFVLYCGISIFWSDYPATSFKRYLRGIGAVMMVLVVLTEKDPVEAMKLILRRCTYVLIPFSILLIKYFRNLGVFYSRWGGAANNAGVTLHKNSLGQLCLISGFFFFCQLAAAWRNRRVSSDKIEVRINILLLLMISWLMMMAHSATSLGSLIAVIFIFICLRLPLFKNNIRIIGIPIFFVFMIAVIFVLSFNLVEYFVASLGRDMTFTTRIYLWKDCLHLVKNPWFGTGYDSFWLGDRITALWEKWWYQPKQAHNGYLELYLELGLIGIFFLTGIIFQTYRTICRTFQVNFNLGRFQIGYFVIFLLSNITEVALKLQSRMFLVFLLTSTITVQRSDPH